MMKDVQDATLAYADYFATLTPENVGNLRALVTADMHFKDPFNDINGVDRVIGLLHHMFETTQGAKFVIRDHALGSSLAFISWDFRCTVARLGQLELVGVSELRFTDDLRVRAHIDHWDAGEQLYQRLPLLGSVLNLIKRRLAFPG
jgi:hypothetical protein